MLDKLYDWSVKHWIISIVAVKLLSIWFSFVITFWGEKWELIAVEDEKKTLTSWGFILTVIIILITLSLTIAERYHEISKDSSQQIQAEAQRNMFRKIEESASVICEDKIKKQLNQIVDILSPDKQVSIPYVYTQPCEQLQIILSELTKCICFLISDSEHSFDRNNLDISLIYNFPNENGGIWQPVDNMHPQMLPLKKLLSKGSTVYHLLNESKQFVFFNNKKQARTNKCYIKDIHDNDDLCGSIGCFLLEFGKNYKTYVRAILTISTYGQQIVDESMFESLFKDDNTIRREIKNANKHMGDNLNYVISQYKNRIGVELCNYYIQFLYKKSNEPKTEE